jgi:hypothetical protein
MRLSGNLQAYYDALDEMGIIDPLLKTDWSELNTLRFLRYSDFEKLIDKMNQLNSAKEKIKKELIAYDAQMIQFFAMEVAKEYAEYHKEKQTH